MRPASPRLPRILIALGLCAALAGCNSTLAPQQTAALSPNLDGFRPDPALMTATRPALTEKIDKACRVMQSRSQNQPQAVFEKPCGCYAERAMSSFSEAELQSYRSQGYFNETAKEKAYQALEACSLQRPA